jgi:2'-5' RNA ligase
MPAQTVQRLGEAQAALTPAAPGVRLARPETLHLTLRFLGQAEEAALDRLAGDLARAAAACPRSEGRFGRLCVFPARGEPRILALDVDLSPPVIEFQRACEAAAVAAGFPAEPRAFRPHLTLGRWRDRARRPRLPEVDLGAFAIAEAVLYRSDLQPDGAVHTPLVHFPFAGP